MSIWKNPPDIQSINALRIGSMAAHLGIEMTECGEDYLKGRMPVDHRTMQPFGIMHGGASCVLAEHLGSVAANCCVDFDTHLCVGLDINVSHLQMAKAGFVTGIATPIRLGTSIQVWEIKIYDENGSQVSWSRLTLAVLKRKP
jgi:uncharacterized protein (TIGR00369 family)